ncbi:hypothetical protein [Flavobacterium pokkalii]|uniref:hypothetical protein n=1 Tax=Flavobacterium pokkalii TaxID=1940408 RepID=UPI001660C462|nr:hypothetical protein [Flavobacterium pokkalii]
MKKTIQIVILSILIFTSCQNKNNDILNGKSFSGFEEDVYFDSPKEIFQTTLTFKNDSVLVLKKLVRIIDKDTLNFKLKGSNYQYKGLVKREKTRIEFVAYPYKCKGCQHSIVMSKKDLWKKDLDNKTYRGFVTKNGLNLNGINFKPE